MDEPNNAAEQSSKYERTSFFPLLIAALFFSLYLLLLLLFSGGDFHQWFRWDFVWFQRIYENGYTFTEPLTFPLPEISAAFLPAFPLLARGLGWIFQLHSSNTAMLLTSLLLCLGFLAYFTLFLVRLKTSRPQIVLSLFLLLSFPGSFFLMFPYAESTSLFATLGFLFWYHHEKQSRLTLLMVVIHGLLLSTSRLVGVIFIFYPFIYSLLQNRFTWSKVFTFKNAVATAAPLVG